jgi:hypothetical protein
VVDAPKRSSSGRINENLWELWRNFFRQMIWLASFCGSHDSSIQVRAQQAPSCDIIEITVAGDDSWALNLNILYRNFWAMWMTTARFNIHISKKFLGMVPRKSTPEIVSHRGLWGNGMLLANFQINTSEKYFRRGKTTGPTPKIFLPKVLRGDGNGICNFPDNYFGKSSEGGQLKGASL